MQRSVFVKLKNVSFNGEPSSIGMESQHHLRPLALSFQVREMRRILQLRAAADPPQRPTVAEDINGSGQAQGEAIA